MPAGEKLSNIKTNHEMENGFKKQIQSLPIHQRVVLLYSTFDLTITCTNWGNLELAGVEESLPCTQPILYTRLRLIAPKSFDKPIEALELADQYLSVLVQE